MGQDLSGKDWQRFQLEQFVENAGIKAPMTFWLRTQDSLELAKYKKLPDTETDDPESKRKPIENQILEVQGGEAVEKE